MPIHIYECGSCGAREDYLVSQGQQPSGCAGCGSSDLTRTFEGQTFNSRTADKGGIHERQGVLVPTGNYVLGEHVTMRSSPSGISISKHPTIAAELRKVFPDSN